MLYEDTKQMMYNIHLKERWQADQFLLPAYQLWSKTGQAQVTTWDKVKYKNKLLLLKLYLGDSKLSGQQLSILNFLEEWVKNRPLFHDLHEDREEIDNFPF